MSEGRSRLPSMGSARQDDCLSWLAPAVGAWISGKAGFAAGLQGRRHAACPDRLDQCPFRSVRRGAGCCPAVLARTQIRDGLLVVSWMLDSARLAWHRFFSPDAMDGGGLTHGMTPVQAVSSTLQNRREPTVLSVLVHAIGTVTMSQSWQAALPAAAILSLVGRVLLGWDHARGAAAAALGFVCSLIPQWPGCS